MAKAKRSKRSLSGLSAYDVQCIILVVLLTGLVTSGLVLAYQGDRGEKAATPEIGTPIINDAEGIALPDSGANTEGQE